MSFPPDVSTALAVARRRNPCLRFADPSASGTMVGMLPREARAAPQGSRRYPPTWMIGGSPVRRSRPSPGAAGRMSGLTVRVDILIRHLDSIHRFDTLLRYIASIRCLYTPRRHRSLPQDLVSIAVTSQEDTTPDRSAGPCGADRARMFCAGHADAGRPVSPAGRMLRISCDGRYGRQATGVPATLRFAGDFVSAAVTSSRLRG